MQRYFPTISSSILLKRFVCTQPQCWQPRSSARQLHSMLDHGHFSSSLHPELAVCTAPCRRHTACMCPNQACHCQGATRHAEKPFTALQECRSKLRRVPEDSYVPNLDKPADSLSGCISYAARALSPACWQHPCSAAGQHAFCPRLLVDCPVLPALPNRLRDCPVHEAQVVRHESA